MKFWSQLCWATQVSIPGPALDYEEERKLEPLAQATTELTNKLGVRKLLLFSSLKS